MRAYVANLFRRQETEQRERDRRIVLSSAAAGVSRGLRVASSLVTIPLLLHYLGPARFSLWNVIASLLSAVWFLDFGIGNGLVNATTLARARGDAAEGRRQVASAAALLSGVAALILLSAVTVLPDLPWTKLLRLDGVPRSEAASTIVISVVCLSFLVPLTVATRVRLGCQETFIQACWDLVNTTLMFVLLLAGMALGAPLHLLILSMTGAPILVGAANAVSLFLREHPELAPGPRDVRPTIVHALLRVGGVFLVVNVGVVLGYSLDGLIAVMTLGSERAAPFIVVLRLLTACQAAVAFLVLPFWPAYGDALARNDMEWVRRALRRAAIATLAIAVPADAVLVALGTRITAWWTAGAAEVPQSLFTAVGAWMLVWSLGTAFSAYLNTEHLLGHYAKMILAFAVSSLALKIVLANTIGAPGIVWADTACYAAAVLAPCVVLLPRSLRGQASCATAHGAQP